MTLMLEKIARAICGVEGNNECEWPEYVNTARAALLAMRDPSVPMLGAGYSSQGNHPDDELMLIDAWPAMIDAILKEGGE